MKPKISINKLGEYMTATPARRKQILRDQKNPLAFKAARYKEARATIVEFMEQGMTNVDGARSIAAELRKDQSGTDFAVQDRQLSAEAIDDFLSISEKIEIDDLSVHGGNTFASEVIEFGGTEVSMRPDALLKNKRTGVIVGCVKFNFSRSSPLQEKSAAYVATALRAHLEANLSTLEHVDPAKCYVVDVPTGTVYLAPKANKKRLSDLVAAGEEIFARWESV
jgi:uncharacterized protein YoaH (UPF0181 family)